MLSIQSLPLVVLVLLTSCESQPPRVRLDESMILANLDGLEKIRESAESMVYVRPDERSLADYDRFLIHPVRVTERAEIEKVDPTELARIRSYFRKALQAELEASGYRVVDKPGAGVLDVILTLTGLEVRSDRHESMSNFLMNVSFDVTSVVVQVELRDSTTGLTEAVALHRTEGPPQVITEWSQAQTAFDRWARDFREALDDVRQR